MSILFGGGKATSEKRDPLRNLQTQVRTSVRASDREIMRIDREEKALLAQLKKCGGAQQIETARLKAKELVRLRAHRTRLTGLKAGLSGLSQQLSEVGSSHRIQATLAQTTGMLQKLNGQLSMVATHRLMREFDRQTTMMTDKQAMVDDALESAFETDNEQAETELAVARVLEEAGMDEALRMHSSRPVCAPAAQDLSDGALEMRLNALRQP